MESPLVIFVLGLVIGVLLTAKSPRDLLAKLDETAPHSYPYLLLGLLVVAASWVLGWIGFVACVTTFVLYQVFGRHGLPDWATNLFDRLRTPKQTLRNNDPTPITVPEQEPAQETRENEDAGGDGGDDGNQPVSQT